ncbi:MAG: metal-sulfur cluster assembly factor [Gammaproteobacteria bacterium]|nr:metal-sulfur cluster assembly factor [Gammaproteobacteria bacterium]
MSHHMLTKDAIRDVLRTVIDPELDVNVVDLGLIYNITISETKIVVYMTLTTPGCPLMSHLINEVAVALHRLAPHVESDVKLVWDPPWHPRMMSESVKQKLGWHEQMPPPAEDEKFCEVTNKRLDNEPKQ